MDFFTKFGLWCRPVDKDNCDKFWDILFKGKNFTRGQSSNFSNRKLAITTVLRYCADSDVLLDNQVLVFL